MPNGFESPLEFACPPHLETYVAVAVNVFASNMCDATEYIENERLAIFLAEKTSAEVFMLPHIQPTLKNADELRKEYLPEGIKQGKNPDFYFCGRLVDGKSMLNAKLADEDKTKDKIQKRLSKAFEQADDAYIEIPLSFPLDWITDAVMGKLKSCEHFHNVYVKYGDELMLFKTKKPDYR